MTPDERFQNWWQSLSARGLEDGRTWRWLPTDGIPVQIQIHSARAGFLAGLASRDAEIEAVAARIEIMPGKSTGAEIADLVRSLLQQREVKQ